MENLNVEYKFNYKYIQNNDVLNYKSSKACIYYEVN